ncbi:MAG: efflux RND transporter periplasmic adaptor subunit [Gammaproteobacteria bacterium]|nr:efflux RND transporter periplasmic adaptor subunit [Gammaproteobacteria bacterium]MBV9697314.1 efflux RND transporter periplasmic adaptor subunit [Gammaproteobacteria bacterium]
MADIPPQPPLLQRRTLWVLVGVVLLLVVWGIASRLVARASLERQADEAAVPTVSVTKPHRNPGADSLVLPGTVQAFYEAPIYARTDGYLKRWYTDIGTPVKKGQLLAEIDTPELDQQLRQAQADLGTAQANYELARTTNERWQGLRATDSVSQQDADQRAGDAAAKAAARQASAANVGRLEQLESFKRVVAPFDGTVTQRNTDVGALITAAQNTGTALFRVADTQRLRIYVSVPQPYAGSIHDGLKAQVVFADRPARSYEAAVANSAHALDPTTRTLQVELQIDNSKGELLPGSYAQVHFVLDRDAPALRVPVNTLLFRAEGLQVATLDAQHHVHLKDIVQGRDFGREIEVIRGIQADDTLVLNPPDSLAEGQPVRLASPPTAGAKAPP